MLAAVADKFPELFHFVRSGSGPSKLWVGSEVITSEDGAQQGNPMGPLEFGVALGTMLERVEARVMIPFAAWIIDDGSMATTIDGASALLNVIEEEAAAIGLQLNRTKCELIVDDDDVAMARLDFPGRVTGHSSMSLFALPCCGDDDHRSAALSETLEALKRKVGVVARMPDKHAAL